MIPTELFPLKEQCETKDMCFRLLFVRLPLVPFRNLYKTNSFIPVRDGSKEG